MNNKIILKSKEHNTYFHFYLLKKRTVLCSLDICQYDYIDTIIIWNLYSYKLRKGYAADLILRVIEKYKHKGIKIINLYCRKTNEPALSLYKKLEFYIKEELEDRYLLEKEL